MAIDTSGTWWKGESPEDLREYLEMYAAEGYAIQEFRLARCECGSVVFKHDRDPDEGVARRACSNCSAERYIGDSEEFWSEAEPEEWSCVECPSKVANIGTGFALYDDGAGIRWLYVGVRCAGCGILGCSVEWKVGHDDMSLLDRA